MNRERAEKILFQSHGDDAKALHWALRKLHTSAQHIRDLLQLVPDGLEGVDLATCRAADAWVKEIGNE